MKIKHNCDECAERSKKLVEESKRLAEKSKRLAEWSKMYVDKCCCGCDEGEVLNE